MSEALRRVGVTRVRADDRAPALDLAAVEEPLEIRLHGEPFAVIMRTPGADVELAAGFLLAEQIVRHADDLETIARCPDADDAAGGNVLDVRLDGRWTGDLPALLASRRQVVTGSSCGLCGRRTIASLRAEAPAPAAGWTIDPARVSALPVQLRRAQAVFEETGGLHAAGLFRPDGTLEAIAEDVGRHNAVDKVIGRMLLAGRLPLAAHLLVVSGRASFEIVQKALLAGIPLVAAVSAPSSLAIDLAAETGITLLGFVRGDTFNIYAHPGRIARVRTL
ncbi:MAG TPA: formate dehydrogenase accessory sulfurtransferase FdhD [Vicinamibacterales bacterium]|nr:formate dehydrogenase accessory sulfurtransferase FdhD [Vicinamibacterales bacterium]